MRRLGIGAAVAIAIAVALVARASLASSVDPGPSATLAPATKHSHCHVQGSLPDHGCTPGAIFVRATAQMVCKWGYTRHVRHVTYDEKSAVDAEYGIHRHFNGENGEVDHLVALELGGSNAEANLWPESAAGPYGSHQKDELENELHHEVCRGSVTLARAQQLIAGDWVSVYRSRFGS